jgi:hypothetical protein
LDWTNLSSQRCAGGEALAWQGDPGAELELVVLEFDFCLLERGGTRAKLNETAEMDEQQERWTGGGCRPCAYAQVQGPLAADHANGSAPTTTPLPLSVFWGSQASRGDHLARPVLE